MKQTWVKFFAFLFAIAFFVPVSVMAQDDKGNKGDKGNKDKDKDKSKGVQQIIVTRKGEKENKCTIEINGDKITINGKPLDEYKDKNGNISVKLNNFKELDALARVPWNGYWNEDGDEGMELFNESSNHAMLGVTTEKSEEKGVVIEDITKGSAAEKVGLKEGDVILKINDKSIEDPDDLSETIKSYEPGEKVTVTYLRDKKEQKVTAELGKWRGMNMVYGPKNFKMDMGDMNIPRIEATPGPYNFSWSTGSPKLGLSIQDTDDGKGVKVIEVDEDSNAAKAGILEDDVITEVDGKAVNGADEITKIIKESKTKISVMIKLVRDGKPMNIEVKMPRKLKSADL